MAITTGSEVKRVAQFSDEYQDEDYNIEIDIVEAELYGKYKLPKRSSFSIDDDYTVFYISDKPVKEVIRLQVNVETSIDPSGWLVIGSDSNWSFTEDNNYITLEPSFISTYDTKLVRVQYIPKIFNLLASNIAALNLIDPTTITDGENTIESPQITRIKNRIDRYKKIISPRIMAKSSVNSEYDTDGYISINQSSYR